MEETSYDCQTQQIRLSVGFVLEDQAVKTPIHLFSECPALAGFRQELFNDSYPSQHTGQQSLCQVTELALHGSIQELIERTD